MAYLPVIAMMMTSLWTSTLEGVVECHLLQSELWKMDRKLYLYGSHLWRLEWGIIPQGTNLGRWSKAIFLGLSALGSIDWVEFNVP